MVEILLDKPVCCLTHGANSVFFAVQLNTLSLLQKRCFANIIVPGKDGVAECSVPHMADAFLFLENNGLF